MVNLYFLYTFAFDFEYICIYVVSMTNTNAYRANTGKYIPLSQKRCLAGDCNDGGEFLFGGFKSEV